MRRFKNQVLLIIIYLITLVIASAQIDTLECLSYLPLQTGNKWYYSVVELTDYGWETGSILKKVIGDTLMANGKLYRNLKPSGPYVRIDTTSLLVYQFHDMSRAGCQDSELVIFDLSLLISKNDSFNRCDNQEIDFYLYEGDAGLIKGSFKNIEYSWFDGIDNSYYLTKDIGISCYGIEEIYSYTEILISAEINGIKYGQWAEEDTLEYLSYYPLHIGDKWQYKEESYEHWWDTVAVVSYPTTEVIGDTILDNGQQYYDFSWNGLKHYRYQRIDTLKLCVYEYSKGACENDEMEILYLKYKPDSTIIQYNCNEEYFEITQWDTGIIAIYRDYLTIKSYNLLKNIGLFGYCEAEIYPGYVLSLIAANVGGIQYGKFLNIENNNYSPSLFLLHQNFPNPFNPETTIRFELPQNSHVRLEIYNLLGQRVTTLLDSPKPAGHYTLKWDGKDQNGNDVASGIYFYKLVAGDFNQIKKMVLTR